MSLLEEEWPFSALGPFLKNGEPSANAIVFGQGTDGKSHPGNAAYRRKISKNASEFKSKSDTKEKHNVTMRVVDEFGREGYFFLFFEKEDLAWRLMEQTEVLKKVKKSLRECNRDRERSGKRKVEEMTQNDEEVPCHNASDDEDQTMDL